MNLLVVPRFSGLAINVIPKEQKRGNQPTILNFDTGQPAWDPITLQVRFYPAGTKGWQDNELRLEDKYLAQNKDLAALSQKWRELLALKDAGTDNRQEFIKNLPDELGKILKIVYGRSLHPNTRYVRRRFRQLGTSIRFILINAGFSPAPKMSNVLELEAPGHLLLCQPPPL